MSKTLIIYFCLISQFNIGIAFTQSIDDTSYTHYLDSHWSSLCDSITNNDKHILIENLNGQAHLWLYRELLYTQLYLYDLNGVHKGIDTLQLLKHQVRKPLNIDYEDSVYIWKYDRIHFYVKSGKVYKWERVNSFKDNPLLISSEAIIKFCSLDSNYINNEKLRPRIDSLISYLTTEGSLNYKDGKYEHSFEYFNVATQLYELNISTINPQVHYNDCGVIAKMLGKNQVAIEYFSKAARLGYKSEQLMIEVSHLYLNNNQTGKAIGILKESIASKKTANSLNALINIYLSQNKYTEAQHYLAQAQKLDRKNATYCFARGAIYDELGDHASAFKYYKKAIKIDNTHIDAYFNLGAFYYNRGIEFFQSANNSSTDKQYEKYMQYALNEYQKAIKYLEKIIELLPEDKETLKHAAYSLKNIYYKLGMYEECKKMKELYQSL